MGSAFFRSALKQLSLSLSSLSKYLCLMIAMVVVWCLAFRSQPYLVRRRIMDYSFLLLLLHLSLTYSPCSHTWLRFWMGGYDFWVSWLSFFDGYWEHSFLTFCFRHFSLLWSMMLLSCFLFLGSVLSHILFSHLVIPCICITTSLFFPLQMSNLLTNGLNQIYMFVIYLSLKVP